MKKILISLVCLISFSTKVYCQDGFVMEYVMEIGDPKNPMKSTNKIWQSAVGTRLESDMNIPGLGPKKTVMLMPKSNPDFMYTIDDAKKSYTEIKTLDDTIANEDFTIEIVGQEKVAGYNCTHAKIKTKEQVMDVWTTKDISGYKEFYNATWVQSAAKGAGKAFASKELEGVMVRMKGGTKEASFTMELVKFEKGNFPKAMFEIPAGYTKGMSFDPAKIQNMSPEERAKMMEELMKHYGNDGNH